MDTPIIMAPDIPPTGSREKLIYATINLIGSRGFECTGIQEILDSASVTKSNFYYHFKSKEELCLAALDELAECFFETVVEKTLLNRSLEPKARLESYFQCAIEKMTTNCCKMGCPFLNLGNETSDFHPAFREKISEIYNRQLNAIELCYCEGVTIGEFSDKLDPHDAAKFILSEANGAILLSKVLKKPEILKKNSDILLALLSK